MSDLQTIFDRYNPEHDINTSKDAPRVTWAEMALAIQVQSLIDRVEKLETAQRHTAPPAATITATIARFTQAAHDVVNDSTSDLSKKIKMINADFDLTPADLAAVDAALEPDSKAVQG